jgi:hypothetical protein
LGALYVDELLQGNAARDYLLSVSSTGDVRAQAALGQEHLIEQLAVDQDLALDPAIGAFVYLDQGLSLDHAHDTNGQHWHGTSVNYSSQHVDMEEQSQGASGALAERSNKNMPAHVQPDPSSDWDTVFRLHSRPASSKKIYLDFNGHLTEGTAWNNARRPSIWTPPFSQDNDEYFSPEELQAIVAMWRAVAEDYAIFDVDVTTEEPPELANANANSDNLSAVRVAIGGNSQTWLGPNAGGVAFIGGFGSYKLQPCFVFPAQLGNGAAKPVWEAISHEGKNNEQRLIECRVHVFRCMRISIGLPNALHINIPDRLATGWVNLDRQDGCTSGSAYQVAPLECTLNIM